MTHLSPQTQQHMADVLASNDNRRIEPDVSLLATVGLGRGVKWAALMWLVAVLLLAAMAVYHYDLEPW